MSALLELREILPEHLIARLWRAKTGQTLRTVDGQRVRVRYPGRPAPGHGPDFQDAILLVDGELVKGDVEVHRTPAGWHAHGHDEDPAYAGVVLHVVSDEGRADPAGLPTVVLQEEASPPSTRPGPLGALATMDEGALRTVLRRAGQSRFRERRRAASGDVRRYGTEQALLLRIFDALGYAENRMPFRELARITGAAMLRAIAGQAHPQHRAAALEGVLLAAAGLGPATPAWSTYIGGIPLIPSAWRTSGVRPANHPRRRIAAAAVLVVRHGHGLVAGLGEAVRGGPRELMAALEVHDAGAALGPARAREIAVSAVLPVLAAAARLRRDRGVSGAVSACYAAFPGLPDNTLTREARRLLGQNSKIRLSAMEHQGLLHLYRAAVRQAR